MRRMRVVGLGLLCLALVAQFVALGGASGNPWRDKVSASLLRWADSAGTGERIVLVGFTSAVQGASDVSYVESAHRAWLSPSTRLAADAVAAVAPLARPGLLLRSGSEAWEAGIPYLHDLGSVLVRCNASQIGPLAQLGVVAALADGSEPVPTPTPIAGEAGGSPSGLATPRDLITRGRLSAGELDQGAAAYSWDIVRLSDIVRWEGEPRLTLRSSPLEEWPTDSYLVMGVALEAEDAGGSGAWLQSGWAGHRLGSLPASSLAWLADALRQAGADTAIVAVVGSAAGEAPVFALLRSETAVSLASLSGTGEILHVGGPVLPRGPAPSDAHATRGTHEDRVFLDWGPVGGAGQYEVLRAVSTSGAFEPVGIAGPGGFDDVDVSTCVTYWYRVRSLGDAGVGLESGAASGYIGLVPHPVTRIWTSASGPGQLLVEWAPAIGATSYCLMRTEPMSDKPKVAAQQYAVYQGVEPRFLDLDVIAGQEHLYRVFAVDGCGKSELSDQARGMALYELPGDPSRLGPPEWVEATRGRPYEKVQVAWRAAPGATAYRVLRALSYAGPYEPVVELSGTTWEDRDVVLCGDYWYRVQSIAGSNVSEPSRIVYGSYGYRPDAPEGVRASAGTYANIIEVTWRPMADAVAYHVSRAPAREGPYATIAESVTTTSFVDEGLVPGQEFWYKVKASNPCGCSGDLGPAYGATLRNETSGCASRRASASVERAGVVRYPTPHEGRRTANLARRSECRSARGRHARRRPVACRRRGGYRQDEDACLSRRLPHLAGR